MGDLERIISSIIDDKVKPLQREIEELKKKLADHKGETTEYLSAQQVTKSYNISRTTLWRFNQKNKLKKYLLGEKVYFKRSEIEELILEC